MPLRHIQTILVQYHGKDPTIPLAISHIHVKDILQPLLLELGPSVKFVRSYKQIIAYGLHHLIKRELIEGTCSLNEKRIWTITVHVRKNVCKCTRFAPYPKPYENTPILDVQLIRSETNKSSQHIPLSHRYLLSDILYKST